jgi:hypothetical protein
VILRICETNPPSSSTEFIIYDPSQTFNSYRGIVTSGNGGACQMTVVWGNNMVANGNYVLKIGDVTCLGYTVSVARTVARDITISTNGSSPNFLCEGESIELIASGDQGVYNWTSSSGESWTNTDRITVTPFSTRTYTVSESYCGKTATGSINVTVYPKVGQVSMPAGETSFCNRDGSTSTYLANALNAASYNWSIEAALGGLSIPGSIPKNDGVVKWNSAFSGEAIIKVIANGVGCGTSTASTVIKVYPLPIASISPSGIITVAALVNSFYLNASTNASYNYKWYLNKNILNGETSATLLASQDGQYQVEVTSNDDCSMKSSITQLIFNNNNYISERNILIDRKQDGTDITEFDVISLQPHEKMEKTTYFDGLGRPMQSVSTQASPNKTDLVTPVVYDAFGRESKKYLPIAAGNDGWYKPNTEIIDAAGNYTGIAANFYNTPSSKVAVDPAPYSETKFEPSPLNRVLKQGAPGASWQPNADIYSMTDNTVKKRYEFNTLSEVYRFKYDATTGLVGLAAVEADKYYLPNQLYANHIFDEHNNEVIEYIDKEGRTVCKKVYVKTVNSVKQYASTYYIYDDLGNLMVVLPPEAVREIGGN